MYATLMPAPFLSVLTDDCIAKGRDYNAGGARYNNTFIQIVGIGSITDCLAACQEVFESGDVSLAELVEALDADFAVGKSCGNAWSTRRPGTATTTTAPTT